MDATRNATRIRHALLAVLIAAVLIAAVLAAAGPAHGHGDEVHEGEAKAAPQGAPAAEPAQGGHKMMGMDRMSSPDMPNMQMPSMNPTRGRRLFVSKGCVACHAINGIGDAARAASPVTRSTGSAATTPPTWTPTQCSR